MYYDTSLAEETLRSVNYENGDVIPPNLIHGMCVHFSADNIELNDAALDAKNIFHTTQMAAWQRGPAQDVILDDLEPSTRQVLHVPEAMECLSEVNIPCGRTSPLFSKPMFHVLSMLHHWRIPKQLTCLSLTSGNHVPK